MQNTEKEKLNPRKVFWKCGACSHAMFRLLNHEFDNTKPVEERAADLLAGGIAQKGHQCGMLWGGSLACGNEAFRRFQNKEIAIVAAVNASKHLVDSFETRTQTLNCRDISRVNWENKLDSFFYMLKVVSRGFVFSPCFNLIAKWTPEAIEAANKGLNDSTGSESLAKSCATEVLKKMGASDEEAMMVAGFAGGIGLSGQACGALGAVVWYKMLQLNKSNPESTQTLFNNQDAKRILRTFYMQTDSEMLCKNICARKFNTLEEHSEYIQNGGCKHIIEALARV